jgi:flagellar hook assembly protein FlgD
VNNVNFTLQPDATTDVSENTVVPETFLLNQNYPNPFNPSTTITFDMPAAGYANLTVFNMLGQEIRTLQNGLAAAGRTSIVWDATDRSGLSVASGLYFYRLTVTGSNGQELFRSVQKMMLVR